MGNILTDLEKQALIVRLESFAFYGDTASFGNLARTIGRNPRSQGVHRLISEWLREEDRRRHEAGLPLLSVLVHRTSASFFGDSRHLGAAATPRLAAKMCRSVMWSERKGTIWFEGPQVRQIMLSALVKPLLALEPAPSASGIRPDSPAPS